jgi:hypothetical protein
MKRHLFFFLPVILLLLFNTTGWSQFTADMHLSTPENHETYQVINDGSRYRYDLEEEGQQITVLVKPEEGKTYIIFPQKKVYQKVSNKSTVSLSNDPVQTLDYLQNAFTVKEIGSETINGLDCKKNEIYAGEQLINRHWYSEELNFPVKIEQLNEYTMELTNIQKKAIENQDAFNVPTEYSEVDRSMQPVLPEPPPPKKWKTKTHKVPFNKKFQRGDQLEIPMEGTGNIQIQFKNTGENQSRVTYYIFRDGKELSLSEQGPEDFRTKKMKPEEEKQIPLRLSAGDMLKIKVFYGTMRISANF